ncbi:MAG: hypothetical protein AMJ53_17090 [Gammaproteobacteria bacterium SG8_11]|nr:MAG: hypothetical protein AMJ53_17090 [Gammaproteobacteria bacterium SG8_11]
MKYIIRIPSLFGLVVLLVGCVTPPAYKIETSAATKSASFTIIDKRAETEKLGGSRSSLITNCEYGITDLSEVEIEPPRLVVLQRRLQAEDSIAKRLSGKEIEIDSFKIIRNYQIPLRNMVLKNKTGALEKALATGCFAGPEIEGSYLVKDNPKGLPSFTILLKAKIGEHRYNVKHFETAASIDNARPTAENNVFPQILNRAIDKFIAEILNRGDV